MGGAVESDFEIKMKSNENIKVSLGKGTIPPKWLGKKWGDKMMQLKVSPLIIPIGPVVIWFDNELSLVFKFTLTLTPGHATFGLSFKKSITVGTQYDHGKGWKDLSASSGPGEVSPQHRAYQYFMQKNCDTRIKRYLSNPLSGTAASASVLSPAPRIPIYIHGVTCTAFPFFIRLQTIGKPDGRKDIPKARGCNS